jgi:hypothetical protein
LEAVVPKLVHRTPKYRRHRASGQAIVTVNGQDFYLGPYGTAVSRREYDRVIAERLANGPRTPFDAAQAISVVELIAAYGATLRVIAPGARPAGTPTASCPAFAWRCAWSSVCTATPPSPTSAASP